MTLQPSLTIADLEREGLVDAGAGRNIGTLDFATDEDFFLFFPERNREYLVTVDSAADTELGLYGVPGLALEFEDPEGGDAGPGFNPALSFRTGERPAAVILQVDAAGAAERSEAGGDPAPGLADYRLDIVDRGPTGPLPGPEVDTVGDEPSGAGVVGAGRNIVEAIESPRDRDVYTVYLEAGTAYAVSAEPFAVEGIGALDPYLELFAPDGRKLRENDDASEETDAAELAFAIEQSGFFFLAVTASELETGTGGYDLSVRDGGPVSTEEDGVPGTFEAAALLEVNRATVEEIETARDVDVFRVALLDGNAYSIDALGLDGFDPALALFGPAGNELGFSDDRAEGDPDPLLTVTAEETGFHYVAVAGGTAEATGRYDLLVDLLDSRAATTTEAQFVALLYRAGFGREADTAGLNFWIEGAESGLSFLDLADTFVASEEFERRVGDPETLPDEALVEALYVDNLGRGADPEGRAFWVEQLGQPDFDAGNLLFAFADATENRALFPEVESIENTEGGWAFTA